MDKRETVVLIPVGEAEEFVSNLRLKYDPSALHGIPAHITVLFPFIPPEKLTNDDLIKLKEIIRFPKFDFKLEKIMTFPGVVFLEPTNKDKFIEITRMIWDNFPDYPPFEGKYLPEINPHLTIGHDMGDKFESCLAEANKLEKKLPITARAEEILLLTSNEGEWVIRERFQLL